MVQSNHAIADFAYNHSSEFKMWKNSSNSIITLSTENEKSLIRLFNHFKNVDKTVCLFREPDINDEATSFCVYGTDDVRRKLSNLSLSLKKYK